MAQVQTPIPTVQQFLGEILSVLIDFLGSVNFTQIQSWSGFNHLWSLTDKLLSSYKSREMYSISQDLFDVFHLYCVVDDSDDGDHEWSEFFKQEDFCKILRFILSLLPTSFSHYSSADSHIQQLMFIVAETDEDLIAAIDINDFDYEIEILSDSYTKNLSLLQSLLQKIESL